ncbi:hypothetical protein [Methylobacterium sp. JK268]
MAAALNTAWAPVAAEPQEARRAVPAEAEAPLPMPAAGANTNRKDAEARAELQLNDLGFSIVSSLKAARELIKQQEAQLAKQAAEYEDRLGILRQEVQQAQDHFEGRNREIATRAEAYVKDMQQRASAQIRIAEEKLRKAVERAEAAEEWLRRVRDEIVLFGH